ncbi:hypothetical protein [Kutzneria chonburiensis]|uniref:Phosphoadenosine phosphosulfate reductase n=1 Tax=Kutzneria chonburiensis TaxID=1483604 RepID=A0ABV6N319_9PSEU|nr:hypothetical protein [Kutzneria chonburiensis]
MTNPDVTVLSLGAGVQSSALALLACEGQLPKPDAAIFADTRWEPRAVYEHLDRLAVALDRAGIPLYRVSWGDLRADTMDETKYLRLPAFVKGRDGRAAMLRRQCTERYKVEPVKRQIRLLLGAKRSRTGAILSPPAGRTAVQWIGFSTDEIGRVSNHHGTPYLTSRYPLLDLGWSRQDCERWLTSKGWTVAKSACIGCPFHGNRTWRELRDQHPAEWADAVAFDHALRARTFVGPIQQPYLHRSLLPLDEAPIDKVTAAELQERQLSLADVELEENGPADGCSPYGCRSGDSVD